ncbi:T9SS type A sorting domain-containing protein [Algibacter sp. Ld11]|uniref:T9SS type A sorting domain-containing protein n=1 Tax=Algibacter sp. Ld11 TaxID=649150 RepID=UPI00386A1147
MKQCYTLWVFTFFLGILNFNAQSDFRKDSIHLFQWDNYNDNWRHNTKEFLTYDNGGIKETNFRRQFLTGTNWVNYYQFNKTYTADNQLESNIQQNWNSPNSGWNDKYKHVYIYDDDGNEIVHENSSYINETWKINSKEVKTYVDNFLNTTTILAHDTSLSVFVPQERTTNNYADSLVDYQIGEIYYRDVAVWENDEKIDYTYNMDRQLTDVEYYGYNSSTGEFSSAPYKKIENKYTAEGLIAESVTQLWFTSEYRNVDRWLYSYVNGNQTEFIIQEWNSSADVWENKYRHLKTYDANDNEIEFIYQSWNTDATPNDWRGFLRIVTYWSLPEVLSSNEFHEKPTFLIYPNPTSEYLKITSNEAINQIQLYDLLGKQVLKTNKNQVDVRALPSGLYLAKIEYGSDTITKKVIIN